MLQNDPLRIPPFHFDPDPAFHFDAVPDPASENDADPDLQHCFKSNVRKICSLLRDDAYLIYFRTPYKRLANQVEELSKKLKE